MFLEEKAHGEPQQWPRWVKKHDAPIVIGDCMATYVVLPQPRKHDES